MAAGNRARWGENVFLNRCKFGSQRHYWATLAGGSAVFIKPLARARGAAREHDCSNRQADVDGQIPHDEPICARKRWHFNYAFDALLLICSQY
jgi:hypothetical protein